MARWLLLPLGLAVAGAAGYLLLASPGPDPASAPATGAGRPAASAHPPHGAAKPGKPMGEIDPASRRQLEEVLEDEGLGR